MENLVPLIGVEAIMTTSDISCRACDGDQLVPVLFLGKTPLANRLLKAAELEAAEPRYPLDLGVCPRCSLVQITESVPPEDLFSDYVYFSSWSDTMLHSAKQLVSRMIERHGLTGNSLAMEVASNDGYLLQYYVQAGVPVLGVEPARNIAEVAERERHVRTRSEFFGLACAKRLRSEGFQADVLHANNVLAHVPDLKGFVSGIAAVLRDTGIASIEVPYVREMIDRVEFDTIYHEHLCYFSLTALNALFERQGLTIFDVEKIPIHGGSLRVFACKAESYPVRPTVTALLDDERSAGLATPAYYSHFATKVEGLRTSLRALLIDLKAQGKRIAAYGASAKGSTLLNYCGIGRDVLDFIADRSTAKHGLFAPGTHLPILAVNALLEHQPDFTLLLTWNFADEILAQQQEYIRRGGRFIIPVPAPQVL